MSSNKNEFFSTHLAGSKLEMDKANPTEINLKKLRVNKKNGNGGNTHNFGNPTLVYFLSNTNIGNSLFKNGNLQLNFREYFDFGTKFGVKKSARRKMMLELRMI